MKNEDIEDLFRTGNFNIEKPVPGHQDRFLEKLERSRNQNQDRGKIRMLLYPLAAIAAGLLFIFTLNGNSFEFGNQNIDLANVSPEMKETQNFYTTLIITELEKVNEAKSPETEMVINDALAQMQKLDLEYEKLKEDLVNSGQDKRVIFAMVTNLQQRIDILKNVLARIDEIKQLKNTQHENNYI